MPQFIHLTDERLARHLQKTGLKPHRVGALPQKFVFATPVLEDFMISHQWLRELKRRGIRTLSAVQFRINDDEPVRVGHFGKEQLETNAVGAVRVFRAHASGLGLQVMIPRKINPREITRVYVPTQLVGWRFYPGAKGKKPCGCPFCQRGEINSRRLREAYEKE